MDGGGSNTAQYCVLSPHVQPGNEAASRLLSVGSVTSVSVYVQVLNSPTVSWEKLESL